MASPERRLAPHEMARDSAVGRDRVLVMPSAGGTIPLDGVASQPQTPDDINQQILELKKEQEMQKQMLWHTFHEKNKQLELQHKLQLEHKYQFAGLSNGVFQELREQRIAEEQQQQRERREREVMRRKENNCSANASSEVKQKLQTFLMNKKQNAATNGMTSSSPYRNWGVVKSSSGESLPAGAGVASVSSHPYKIPQPPSSIAKYDSDFPLRKTASEPNLLKIRLKQSVIERKARNGPLAARRQERLLQAAQRRQQKQQNSALATPTNCTTTPDSGPNSPPTLTNRGSPTSAPIQEENEDPNYQGNRGSINDLALFSSPSMPNISLGRPHLANAHNANNLALLSNFRTHAQMAAAAAAAGAAYYNPMPPIDHHAELASHLHPSNIHHMAATHLAMHGQVPGLYGQPITDTQVAHARLNKQGHRPLGRTQSAPLPLGHPMLTGAGNVNIGQTHYENSDAERQAMEQQHLLLTQKIRQTVLTRVGGSREPQLKEEESGEVIDLTDKKQPPKTVLTSSVITSAAQRQSEERLRDQEYLKQQRELLIRQSMHISVDDPFTRGFVKPLSRTLSSPLVHLGQQPPCSIPDTGQHSLDNSPPPVNLTVPHRRSLTGGAPGPTHVTTGLAFDNQMLKHACICGDNSSHPEHSGRLQSVWARLVETGLASRCDRLRARRATQEELQTVHTEAHTMLFGTNQLNRHKLDASRVSFVRLACGGLGVDLDTTWNEHHTSAAARMAAGCVIDLAMKAAKGDIRNGFAVVRPPGHHAEPDAAMGFCFFNSIAVAARLVRQRVPEMRRVLIVDWDVHHGNGTQQVFYDDPSVLYLSIHRHDDGNFFPGTGGPTECGVGPGVGFNVNVAWSGGLSPPLGDAEYLAAFRTVVMPIAREFAPDIVLVSAGFDAASGHPPPLGGYMVSPACFGHLTRELMQLAEGRVILALEGGYDLPAICDSAQECVRALLGDDLSQIADTELARPPCQNAIETIQKTIAIQMSHWPAVKRLAHTVAFSAVQALSSERDESDTVTAMAGLSMQSLHRSSRDLSREDSEEPMDQDDK
ncbi:histone deacetylase 4 isoform X5 [Phlebotomus papatasi]|uniref:histone deacetylase 4 isoform X5 n=1 Tax=Phlebotomus papatasi TaxID=29031 RepID=UPI002483F369|nr:histone deacetylase 4 isoform X5 [Phlebotomus papatasi]